MHQPRFFLRPLLYAILLGLFCAHGAVAQTPARTLSDTVPLDTDGEVHIDNHEGRIIVDTWDRAEVRYEIRIMPTDDDPEAEKTEIEIDRRANRLRLATVHAEGDDESSVFGFSFDRGWQWGGTDIPAVHYALTVPRTARIDIEDHESEIDVSGLQATLRIDTHEGPITVSAHRGDVFIDNHDSETELQDIEGELEIDTHDGPVSVADHRGGLIVESHDSEMDLRAITGFVEIDTHDGELTLVDLRGGFRLDAHEADADVSIAELSDDVDIDTHDGRIVLRLAADAAFDLRTDFDEDVDLDSDFDLAPIRISDEDDDEVNYRGAINGGGPRIYLSSHDGDFDLRIR